MSLPTLAPDRSVFLAQARAQGRGCVPLWARLSADYETPLSAYHKLHDGQNAFLLESAESNSAGGRYSIVGSRPTAVLSAYGRDLTLTARDGSSRSWTAQGDILQEVDQLLASYQAPRPAAHAAADLPPFTGGVVGCLGFDAVRQFEPSIGEPPPDELGLPDAVWMVATEVVVFDHLKRHLHVIVNAVIDAETNLEAAYDEALARLKAQVARLDAALPFRHFDTLEPGVTLERQSNTSREQYEGMVRAAKEFIAAGDIFQVVPSQRFAVEFSGSPTDLHRALRQVNPSPYMFCIEFAEGFALVGSSPEVHVRLLEGRVEIRPIAGTRHRSADPAEDDALATELLADPKERAEHVMLVDLARNDVGRISQAGSVVVDDFMIVERYSHVMHIVSNVSGQLAPGRSACDVLRATFPAGTVSGSPKVRALQIIHQLELAKRGAYAGAVGWIGFDGELDSCIALRTCVVKDGRVFVQAGAGVVADSDPAAEWQETVNKAAGMIRAVEIAEGLARHGRELPER